MAKKKEIVNERAKAGSGTKHDKHAPKAKEHIEEVEAQEQAQAEKEENESE